MKIRVFAAIFPLVISICCPAWAADDSVLWPSIVLITNQANQLFGRPLPGGNTGVIRSTDKIALFYVLLRSVGISKRTHKIRIECVDSKGEEVVSKSIEQTIPDLTAQQYLDKQSGAFEEFLLLDPSPDAVVKGQKKKLEAGQNYYFRLFIDGKMSALSSFRYDR